MTIKELQKAIKSIDGITIGESKISDRYFMKLVEEVGELSISIRKNKRMIDNNIKGTIEEEIYDVLYYIICLANSYDIDLEKSIFLKEELNAKKYNRKNIMKIEKEE
ncbi:MAG: MazG nucleotide pyrophosphohydrolase domain-containing protein [Clostridia bacterium]